MIPLSRQRFPAGITSQGDSGVFQLCSWGAAGLISAHCATKFTLPWWKSGNFRSGWWREGLDKFIFWDYSPVGWIFNVNIVCLGERVELCCKYMPENENGRKEKDKQIKIFLI